MPDPLDPGKITKNPASRVFAPGQGRFNPIRSKNSSISEDKVEDIRSCWQPPPTADQSRAKVRFSDPKIEEAPVGTSPTGSLCDRGF